mmetsp:Transcript_11491/g.21490  ORF Transcript_11491/g.21490 Transcript_11491/m.21490 type:complete len:461 (-) Transcript_11491:1778-3160(-)
MFVTLHYSETYRKIPTPSKWPIAILFTILCFGLQISVDALVSIHLERPFVPVILKSPVSSNGYSKRGLYCVRPLHHGGMIPSGRSRGICKMSTPSTMPHADLAVRLDQPLLSPTQYQSASNYMIRSALAILVSDVFKTACVAFLIAFLITFASKSTRRIKKSVQGVSSALNHVSRLAKGKFMRFTERFQRETKGIPMVFEGTGEEGWGVCTLSKVQPLARSQFTEYEFKLPNEEYFLQYALGQQVTLCCLDSADNVAKKNYFVYNPGKKKQKGHFSVIAKQYIPENSVEMKKRRARGEGDFEQVLATELDIGDEIAIQLGPRTLEYKGEYLPVTDMVYFVAADGIVPVMDQVKSVLPSGSSSVKGVSVIWTNKDEKDFDVALSTLEDEYFKYSTKLAVSCVLEDHYASLSQNEEIDEAVPNFNPGTMAVVSGPKSFSAEAVAVLMKKGFPENCICVLPCD